MMKPFDEAVRAATAQRTVVYRTKGRRQGPITRLMSPDDLGELVKPFVFLDAFDVESFSGPGFAAHPHSGIATHTTLLEGTFDYGDSTGKSGTMPPGSLEWMQAGGGVWHWGAPRPNGPVRGFQLWLALPPHLELEAARSQYIESPFIPSDSTVRLLLGRYGAMRSSIAYEEPVTYLHVRLAPGQVFTFMPPEGHDVAWVAITRGRLEVGADTLEREMAVFAEGGGDIVFRANGQSEFVLGSARKHPYPLVCGYYSVHTSDQTLVRGETAIEAIGRTPAVMARRRA